MVSQKVANQLVELIENGEVAIGSYLPPTRELALRFDVSQHTVGMALKQLEGSRLIECLPRQGARVMARTPQAESQTKQVAIISQPVDFAGMRTPWTSLTIHAMEQALFESGYSVALVSVPQEGDAEAQVRARLDLLGSSVAGALCFPNRILFRVLGELEGRRLPWVAVNRPHLDFNRNFVTADHYAAGRKVGEIFVECGFERVLLLTSNLEESVSSLETYAGLFQAYMQKGMSTQGLRAISCAGWEEGDGYQMVKDLPAREGDRPQAVFATGDYLALGAMRAFNEAGLRVPEDVSVVAATGLPGSDNSHSSLTVVTQETREVGRSAGILLHQMIRKGAFQCAPRQIACKLILRRSLRLPEALRQGLERNADGEVLLGAEMDGISMQLQSEAAEAAT